MNKSINHHAGLLTLSLRLVIGWTYFSAFFRRTILENKLDPEAAGYIGEKFNHFLPNALGIKPLILHLVENPDTLWVSMVAFTIIEGIVGLLLMLGLFTRLMSLGVFGLAMGILLGSGWIGTTCLDEWQIGVLGVSTGWMLFLTGSGQYSLDNWLMRKNQKVTQNKWFVWVASGTLPIKEKVLPKIVLVVAILIFGLTLMTNQIFHGGVWGTLHNKSVKPKLEITEGVIDQEKISFDVFRTEGVDVYGAWMINIQLKDQQNNIVINYTQEDLSQLNDRNIQNYYVAKIKPGKHSLIIPLGAKAKMNLYDSIIGSLPAGAYQLVITDISGASWEHTMIK